MRAVATTRRIAREVTDTGRLADPRISCPATSASEAIGRTAAIRRESVPATRVPDFGLPAAAIALAGPPALRAAPRRTLKPPAAVAWRESDRRKTQSPLPLLAAILVFVACAFPAVTALAQGKPDFVRLIGALETDPEELAAPAGLAFSTEADEFLVIEKPNASSRRSRGLARLSDAYGVTGTLTIPITVADPVNVVFDDLNGRLLLLTPGGGNLIEIKAGNNGVPKPNDLRETSAEHFGVTDPQGMAIDPVTGDLFILDVFGPEILRVRPDPVRGFDWPEISAIDLRTHGLDAFALRGIAFDPTTGHLHVLSPTELRLYEVKETGVIAANRDLSGLGLRDPQGMVFAPSRDQTDNPSEMSLYIADSGAVAAARSGGWTGSITEISLTATAASAIRFE